MRTVELSEGRRICWSEWQHAPLAMHGETVVVPLEPHVLAGFARDSAVEKWRLTLANEPGMKPARPYGAPTVTDDGLLVLPMKSHVVAVDIASGALRWRLPTHGWWIAPCVVDGRCIVPGRERVTAVDAATGAKLWVAKHDGWATMHPCGGGGRVYVGLATPKGGIDNPEGVACLDASDGRLIWRHVEVGLDETPVLDGDVVYLGRPQGLTAWDAATGALLWKVDVCPDVRGPAGVPAIGRDRAVLREGHFGPVRAIDLGRREAAWRFDPSVGGVFASAPLRIWGDAALVFDSQATLHAIGLADGREWWVQARPDGAPWSMYGKHTWANAHPPLVDDAGRIWLAGTTGWSALEW